eukprot:3392378-Amphidinium_carterae.1
MDTVFALAVVAVSAEGAGTRRAHGSPPAFRGPRHINEFAWIPYSHLRCRRCVWGMGFAFRAGRHARRVLCCAHTRPRVSGKGAAQE